jgi:hypothetical protein
VRSNRNPLRQRGIRCSREKSRQPNRNDIDAAIRGTLSGFTRDDDRK